MKKSDKKILIANRYRVIRPLGEGGMSIVYLVEDTLAEKDDPNRSLALKFLKTHSDPKQIQLFKQEFSLLIQLRHPNLAQVFDFGYDRKRKQFFFTSEFIEGKDIFQETRGIPVKRIYPFFIQICTVLNYIHDQGILHNDLKPSNILVSKEKVKILDFGISSLMVLSKASKDQVYGGTAGYIAPEVIRNQKTSPASDLFAFGMVLFKVLTGRLPFEGPSQTIMQKTVSQTIPKITHFSSKLVPDLSNLVDSLIQFHPKRRPASTQKVLDVLSKISNIDILPVQNLENQDLLEKSVFVGRQKEINQIFSFIRNEEEKIYPKRYMQIFGEEGIGKSRFLREIGSYLQLKDWAFCYASCKISASGAFHPWGIIFRQLQGYLESSESENQKVILTVLEGEKSKDSEGEDWGKQTLDQKLRFFHVFSEIINSIAKEYPLAIALDDLHLADADTLTLLGHLLQSCKGNLSFLTTALDTPEEPFRSFFNQNKEAVVHLNPFTLNEVKSFLNFILNQTKIPEEFIHFIHHFSNGVPQTIQDALNNLITKNWLRKIRGSWDFSKELFKNIKSLSGPLEFFQSQYEGFEKKDQHFISICSIFSSSFQINDISKLTNMDLPKVNIKIHFFIKQGILNSIGSQEFGWSQEKFREWLYKNFEKEDSKFLLKLHQKIGDYFLYKAKGSYRLNYLEKGFFHFNACSDKKRMASCALKLGHDFLNRLSLTRAEQYFLSALSNIEFLDPNSQTILKFNIIELNLSKGVGIKNLPLIEKLIPQFSNDPPKYAYLIIHLVYIYRMSQKNEEALSKAKDAIKKLNTPDTDVLKARLLAQQAIIEGDIGEPEKSMHTIEQALSLVPLKKNPERHANFINVRGNILLSKLHNYDLAISDFNRTLEISKQIQNLQGQALAFHNLGVCFSSKGNLQEAKIYYEKALKVARSIGDLTRIRNCLVSLGNLEMSLSQLQDAKARFLETLDLAFLAQHETLQIRLYFNLARIAQLQLDFEESLKFYRKADHLIGFSQDKSAYSSDLLSWALLLMTLGDLKSAEILLHETLSFSNPDHHDSLMGTNYLYLGEMYSLMGNHSKCQESLAMAKKIFKSLNLPTKYAEVEITRFHAELRFPEPNKIFRVDQAFKILQSLKKSNSIITIIYAEILVLKLIHHSLPFQPDHLERAQQVYHKYAKYWPSLSEYYVDFLIVLSEFWLKMNNPINALDTLEEGERILKNILSKLSPENKAYFQKTHNYQKFIQNIGRIHKLKNPQIILWQQTKKKTFKFDLLNKFCNNLYQSFPNFEKLYELVPQQLLQIMNCENAAFFLFDETGLQIKTWAPHSFSKESQNTAFFQKMNQVLQDEGPKIFKLHKVKKFGKTFCFPLLETELHPQGVLLIEKEHLDSIDEEIFNGYGELIETVLTQIKEYQKEENRVDSTTVEMTFLTKTLMMENFTQSIPYKYENFIGGRTPAVKKMTHIMDKMTFSHLPVLLIGEAETGKKTIAEILHREGPWCNHNFVSVNCASLAPELLDSQLFGVLKGAFTDARNDMEGFLSQANGGTLFLENIEEISPSLQIKLLRVLQNGEYQPLGSSEIKTAHFRLIVSAKRDPKELVRLGKFREDLFFRFNVGRIQVPPLRKRKEEIPFIIDHLLEKISLKLGKPKKHLLPAALKILCFFPWPGNFLQLENILNQLYILHRKKRIDLNDLPDEVLPEREDRSESVILPLDVAKTKFQKEYIFRLLNFAQGNVTQAAKLSGLPRQTVNRHKRNYGIYP